MHRYEDSYDEYDETLEDERESGHRGKRLIALLLIGIGLVGSTVAANISIGNGRIEMGQGLYRIKACDQWVAVGLNPSEAVYGGLSKVKSIDLIGLDPRLCKNVVFRIKFFKNSDLNTALPLFYGVTGSDTTTGTVTLGNVTQLSIYDTATVSFPATATYNQYASKALTLINMAGTNVGYADTYHSITYYAAAGVYRINFLEPNANQTDLKCFMNEVEKITIESSNLPS